MTKQWYSCNPLREAQEKAAKWDAVVRCKDCKHYYEKSEEDLVFCLNRSFLGGANYAETDPNGFCAWGERRES